MPTGRHWPIRRVTADAVAHDGTQISEDLRARRALFGLLGELIEFIMGIEAHRGKAERHLQCRHGRRRLQQLRAGRGAQTEINRVMRLGRACRQTIILSI
jgi:hypothetical protein